MKNILYLNNYISDEIIRERNNGRFFSQPANNKIENVVRALGSTDARMTVISSALTSARRAKWFPTVTGATLLGAELIYCGVLSVPLVNSLSSALSVFRMIKKRHREETIDEIIFYNFKPEIAWPAYWAAKRLGIPIAVEYEDGYKHVDGMSRLKRKIFEQTETTVKKWISHAIVANTQMQREFSVPCFVLRGIVNPAFLEKCRAYQKQRNAEFTILYSGGLDRSRGIQVLLKAMEYLRIPCKLLITGKGSIDVSDGRISFLGFLPYEEVLEHMLQADLLIQCQLVNDPFANASFPSKLFEYIATGNHIVSSALSEVEDFGRDMLLFYHNDDPEELSARINEVFRAWEQGCDKAPEVIELCRDNLPEPIGKRLYGFLFDRDPEDKTS